MSSVDDRIVNMQFNNKQFLQGASDSQKALEGLEKSVVNTAKSKGLSTLGSGVDAVKAKFSAMQVAGVAAVATIASKATSAGLNLIKSFTLDPVMDGFNEYQTNLNSIQTIIANTGAKVGTVNKYLNQLNHYSDKTVYNFSQMADAIGKFTSAGVDLKTSTAAIKGMANVAALSGSNTQQLNTAMYQMSQALASGTIRLQDWNSLVNAGMGGKNLQNALKTTAKSMGTDVDGMIKKYGSFRESLTQGGWLTTKVFTQTMSAFTNDYSKKQLMAMGYSKEQAAQMKDLAKRAMHAAQDIKTFPQLLSTVKEALGSVWSQSFQDILGNFQQSKKLWTSVGKTLIGKHGVISNMGNSIHGMLQEWAKAGGRHDIIKGFKNLFGGIGDVLATVKEAFRDVFPPEMGNTLVKFSEGFKKFTKALVPSSSTLEDLRSIFGGIFAVLHIGLTIISAVGAAFKGLLSGIFKQSSGARGGILDIFAAVGEVLKAFDKWLSSGGKLMTVFEKMGHIVGAFIAPVVLGVSLLVKTMGNLAKGIDLSGLSKPLGEARDSIESFMTLASAGVKSLSGPLNEAKADVINFASAAAGVAAKITAPFDKVSGVFGNLKDKLSGLASGVGGSGDSVHPMTRAEAEAAGKLKEFRALTNAGLGGKAMATSVDGISKAFDKLQSSTSAAGGAVENLYSSFKGGSAKAATTSANGLSAAASGAGNTWAAVGEVLKAVGSGIKKTFQSLGDVFSWVKGQFSDLFGSYDALDWASVLNALFTGSLILTMKNFIQVMKESFGGIGTSIKDTFGQLTSTLKSMQTQIKAKAIEAIAIAVGVLAGAVFLLSIIKIKPLAQSLGAIGVMLSLLVGSLFMLSKIQGEFSMAAFAASMVLISMSLLNLAAAVVLLGKQDLATLGKGLGAIAIGLGLMLGAVTAFSKVKGSIEGFAAALLAMSIALNVLALAVLSFGNMSLETLAKGLGAMAIALGIMLGAILAFDKFDKKSIEGFAASILIMSAAMVVLSAAIGAFGNMDTGTLVKGFIAMGAGMLIMVGSLIALSKAGPATLAAAGAMVLMAGAMNVMVTAVALLGNMDWGTILKGIVALTLLAVPILAVGAAAELVGPGLITLGVAVGIMGAAMLAAGTGMALFGAGFAVLAVTGTAGVAVLVAAFQAFMALLPSIAVQVGAAFVSFLQTIAAAAPKVRAAMDTIFQNLLGVITDNIPAIGKLFNQLIGTILDVVGNKKNLNKLVTAGMNLIMAILDGVDANIKQIVTKAGDIIVHFINGIGDQSDRIVTAGAKVIIKFIKGLGENGAKIADAAGSTVLKFLNDLDDSINRYEPQIVKEGGKIAFDLINGLTGGLLGDGIAKVKSAVETLAHSIPGPVRKILGIHSPSKVFIEIGQFIGLGLARGVTNTTSIAIKALSRMTNALISHGNQAVSQAQQVAANAQNAADQALAKAQATQAAADKLAKKHPNSKKTKKLQAQATRQQSKADRMQTRADAASQAVDDQQSIQTSLIQKDFSSVGDTYSQEAQDAASQAQTLIAQANAQRAEASKLSGKANAKERKALRDAADKNVKAAQQLADKALKLGTTAQTYYGQTISQRVSDLTANRAQSDKDLKDQEAFDAADTKGQAAIMEQRAIEQQQLADQKNKEANDLIAQAQQQASLGNFDAANALMDQAEAAASAAEAAAQAAYQDKQQAKQLADQASQSAATATAAALQPSKGVLEDAARAVDRYSSSLAQAESAAASAPPTIQFVQTNTSPTALTASEIYRQTKNLLSAQEIKMGA